jgi:RNA polymerase sigma factor (sigma-70 family)
MTDLLASIWDETFQRAPTLSQERVLDVFACMDEVMQAMIETIVVSPVVRATIMDEAAIVAGNLSHGRGIFERSGLDRSPPHAKPRWSDARDIAWAVDPTETFRLKGRPDRDAIEFLETAMRFCAAGLAGRLDAGIVRACRLSRASRELVVQAFLDVADQYERWSWVSSRCAAAGDLNGLCAATAQLQRAEQALGVPRSRLYGMVATVRQNLKQYDALRKVVFVPYLRVVFRVAKSRAASQIQTLENYQNGAIGLMSAISNYNRQRGVFSSYAQTWATQGILLKLKEEANPIKLPAGMWQLAAKLQEIAQRHANESIDGQVDMEAVAREAGLDLERAIKVLDKVKLNQMHSLDFESHDDPDAPNLHDTLAADAPDELPDIDQFCEQLTRDQRRILFLQHGLIDKIDGPVPTDPVELAVERLRQVVAAALRA